MKKAISVAVISSSVGKAPRDIAYSFIFDEAHRLANRGVNVYVVRSKIEKDSLSYGIHFHGIEKKIDSQALNALMRNITYYPPVSLLRKPAALYWENLYASNVSRVIGKNNINLVHAHFIYPEGFAGFIVKRWFKIPLIITAHGYDLNVVPEYSYGLRLKSQYDLLIRRVISYADRLIVPSKLLYLRALEIGADKSKISVLPNAVDVNRFNPYVDGEIFRKKYKLDDDPIIMVIRGLNKHYRVDKVIEIVKKMPKEMRFKFVIIGNGELRSELMSMAGNLLNKKIIFLGQILHSQIPYAIAAANIVFDPCPIGQGINVLETMATGRPCIGVKTNGLWDYIIDNITGYLVNLDDINEIVEKINYLLDNPDEAKHMGMNGRKIVEEKFNIEKRIEKIISLYESLSAGGS